MRSTVPFLSERSSSKRVNLLLTMVKENTMMAVSRVEMQSPADNACSKRKCKIQSTCGKYQQKKKKYKKPIT